MTNTPRWQSASRIVLYALFALTGFTTAMLGVILPALRSLWGLNDSQAGMLFLMYFVGSSVGALLARGNMAWSVLRGLVCSFIACFFMATIRRSDNFSDLPMYFFWALLGLGMGIVMTSITVLLSARANERRVRELNLLNVIWPAGALACPLLAKVILDTAGVRALFVGLGLALVVFAFWTLCVETRIDAVPEPQVTRAQHGTKPLPILLAAAAFFTVGTESATGGWIASYAHSLHAAATNNIAAVTLFWAGLLLSRMLHATPRFTRAGEVVMMRRGAVLVAAGAVLMVALPYAPTVACGAFLAGFGVGPLYPALLAVVLPRVRGRAVFLLAGLGGASMPWVAGQLANWQGSVRDAMMVPLAGSLLLLLLMPLFGGAARKLSA